MKRHQLISGSRRSGRRQRTGQRQFRARFEHLEARALLSATPAPQLLKDINTTPLDSSPVLGAKLGRFTYFTAIDPTHGEELWRTDGTEAGTKLVKDVASGAVGPGSGQPADSNIRDMIVWNGALYFSAEDSAHGRELWRSDGTRDGTKLLKDVEKGAGSSTTADLVIYRGAIYFAAWDHVHGAGLWRTNGTTSGTVLVKSFGTASDSVRGLTLMNGKLYFTAGNLNTGTKAYVSDGTASGTQLLTGYKPNGARPIPFANVGGQDYFVVANGSSNALYRSNGASAAPKLLKDFGSGRSIGGAMVVGREMYFTVQDNTGNQLWRTDGTIQGTKLVRQLNTLNPSLFVSNITSWTSAGGKLFFTIGSDANGIELWSSDGTRTGTNIVRDIDPTDDGYPQIVHTAGITVFFTANDGTHGVELWRTDGTAAKTLRVADYNGNVVASFLFQGFDPIHGRELWTSNGTAGGTELVKDIDPRTAGINPQFLGDAHGVVFFEADYSGSSGLWKTDGTTEGTSLVKVLRGKATAATVGGFLYFFQPDEAGTSVELWKSDGTPEGTVLVKHLEPTPQSPGFPLLVASSFTSSVYTGGTTIDTDPRIDSIANLTVVGNTLYFTARDRYGSGNELWKTDGTEAGTVLVKDVFAGSSGSNPHGLVELNGALYFRASSPLYTDSLWKTDGTPENTVLVKEIQGYPSAPIGSERILKAGNKLYFGAFDPATGFELWQSDGTPEGTQVMDLAPGTDSSNVRIILSVNNNLFFTKGSELWRTDGTPEGTLRLASDISIPVSSDGYLAAAVLGDSIVFSAFSTTSFEQSVWISNGTVEGTKLLANVSINRFVTQNGKVYFGAFGGDAGDGMWATDGTVVGTELVAQIDGGVGYLAGFGNFLFFTSNDHLHGTEVWKLEIPAGPVIGGLIKTGPGTLLLPNSTNSAAGGTLRVNSVASSNKLSIATNGDLATATVLPTTLAPTSLGLSGVAPAVGTESVIDDLLATESLVNPIAF
jgi:ELWxxDGT repeat protein